MFFRTRFLQLLCTLLACAALTQTYVHAQRPNPGGERYWPQWRGPFADGVARKSNPPKDWGPSKNVKWKVSIPGEGSATPIIWDNKIFIAAAIETDKVASTPPKSNAEAKTTPPANFFQFVLICLDRNTGQELWRQVACEQVPHEGKHYTNTFASASPTTDGRRVYVSFGSRGVYCYDLAGELLWTRDLGDMRTRFGWGEATSPVVHDDSLIINWDHEDQSFIEILDAMSGRTKWKADRDEPTSWATPLVVDFDESTQVIANGTNRVRSYDLATGQVVWQCGGQSVNAIPSPILSGETVFCMSGYRTSAALAIPLRSTGDITDTDRILWQHKQGTPYVPSPIVVEDHIYFTASNTGVLSCLNIHTGKPIFARQRLPELKSVYASPVAANGRIYFTDRDGTTVVIRHGDELEVLAINTLAEPVDASPAIVDNQIFLRTATNLYCIENRAP
ncbi:MAG: PQQ-binding-like beta-propeller repeat protein [Planctomycetaceae bacterium]|nr:PQQ-binding-like beta-propeller repeat protein [Planctomycetales bacterium]MCB9927275.1 PQQ-binding-like beta-propeller repeat protein [Planctomycetaceae bacterium]